MMNTFENDQAYLSLNWIMKLVKARGLQVLHLLRVVHLATGASHYVAILPDNRYICDCCMGLNVGVPCRHYFQVWTTVKGLVFHISLIRPR